VYNKNTFAKVYIFTGDHADKHLAKALKKDEKRKLEARKEKEKEKPKRRFGFKAQYRQYQPQPYNGYQPQGGYQQQGAYAQNQVAGPSQQFNRPEPKNCSNCRQFGHYFRNCPYRAVPSAALGAPPPPPPQK
jgi:hypothetical protein